MSDESDRPRPPLRTPPRFAQAVEGATATYD